MSRIYFAHLLKKYLSGNATDSERQTVEQWYGLLEEEPRPLGKEQWDELEHRLWLKISREEGAGQEARLPVQRALWSRRTMNMAVAASIALLILAGFWIYNRSFEIDKFAQYKRMEGMRVVVNRGTTEMPVMMEDGSRAMLNPGAELCLPGHFEAGKREVFLKGEAFFEVSENTDRPFLVHTGQITTKVLGTSFRVKAPENSLEVEVAVNTGKVAVFEEGKSDLFQSSKSGNGVILNPNHQVTFVKKSKLFVTSLVDNPVALPATTQTNLPSFQYTDTPLSDVLKELERVYRIEMEVEKNSLIACPLTANLSNKGLYAQLDLICAAIQGTYDVKGTTILISGKGCD